jgi:hypothetical protein
MVAGMEAMHMLSNRDLYSPSQPSYDHYNLPAAAETKSESIISQVNWPAFNMEGKGFFLIGINTLDINLFALRQYLWQNYHLWT